MSPIATPPAHALCSAYLLATRPYWPHAGLVCRLVSLPQVKHRPEHRHAHRCNQLHHRHRGRRQRSAAAAISASASTAPSVLVAVADAAPTRLAERLQRLVVERQRLLGGGSAASALEAERMHAEVARGGVWVA